MVTQAVSEAIALTEKKMDMSLDDIIKMSKKTTSKAKIPPRASNKSQGFLNGRGPQGNFNLHRFMDSRSSIRQGVLAKRRTHFQGNQFPITTNVANRAAAYSTSNWMVNWNKPSAAGTSFRRNDGEKSFAGKDKMLVPKQKPQTLDARFASIKEQRIRAMTHQQQMVRGSILQTVAAQRRRTHQQQHGRVTTQYGRASRPFGKFAR
ncbi:uncharacterized protein LOC120261579 isoform X2 [Dioscorea cayenensis subsp. rotundata]|uniref:Uncharacterized protein LOC120261579 isoform X2 n=1 Tax=Dioscorea cayennensis subsp. rotundata TaxID=55577 RepID=A0AB40BDR0_DIOCR|nr:uncharacterized protein LOC120261579 isoform X2 [Dioscorea cayenensis subsp. rotundata]